MRWRGFEREAGLTLWLIVIVQRGRRSSLDYRKYPFTPRSIGGNVFPPARFDPSGNRPFRRGLAPKPLSRFI